MPNNTKVSVIVPVYNGEKYLQRCLNSITKQTLKDIEILCIDDCSTDNSLNIIEDFAVTDKRIKIFRHLKNSGESKARNTGLENSTGEYLSFVDNDDTIDLDFLEKLYKKAKETNADIVKAKAHVFSYDGLEYFDNLNQKIKKHNSKLFFSSYWWTAIYKKELLENIKFLENYPLGGDVLFLNQAILKAKNLEIIDNTCYNYYRREDSGDSKILTFEKVKSALEIHEMIINNTLDANLEDTKGIEHICTWSIINALNYAYRNKTAENLNFCVKKLFQFYEKTNKYVKEENISNMLPIILDFLKRGDEQGLVNLFLKYDNPQKMFFANLRYLHPLLKSDCRYFS